MSVNALEREYIAAPAIWASYFINGDASGLSKQEIAKADKWVKDNSDSYVYDCCPDSIICQFDGLLTECILYTFCLDY